MGLSGVEPPWDDGDDQSNEENESYPLLPPPDRLWRHPSEAMLPGDSSSRRRSRRTGATNRRTARTYLSLVFLALIAGVMGAWSYQTMFSSAPPRLKPPPANLVTLPAGISKKIQQISSAVIAIKSPTGTFWQAATFVNSANYLVTSGDGLSADEILLERSHSNNWQKLWVAAVDPLTDSAILRTTQPSSQYISNYVKDSPQAGALDELVYPRKLSSGDILQMAEVVNVSTPLTLSAKLYVPNSIELDTTGVGIPLGTLVLDPEGDPIGIVVKTTPSKTGSKLYATPMPSIARITNLVENHLGVLHGYLGVVGKTVSLKGAGTYTVGVEITSITSGSPAEKAKLPVGSVIVTLDGSKVGTLPSLQAILLSSEPGSDVTLGIEISGRYTSFRIALANHP